MSKASNHIQTLPAPTGGLNVLDPLTAMPFTDAIVINNMWPQAYGVAVRKGTAEWSNGYPAGVETLASYSSAAGAEYMFAWSDTDMYDASNDGAVGAAMVTGLSNARWETTSITNSAGSHLICVNGVDNGIIYNSSGVNRLVAGNGVDIWTWAGVDPADIQQVTVHQGRLWGVEVNSSRGWYLGVGQIQGTFVSFDFGPLFSRGGGLRYLFTWTVDDGSGAEDLLVGVSNNGEAVVYKGTNPASASTWALVGVYYTGSPVSGLRSFTKLAGDMLLITQRGIISMQALLKTTEQETVTSKARKVQPLLTELASTYSILFGWQLIYVPPFDMLLLNVPTIVGGVYNLQLATNESLPENPWAKFSAMPAVCWCVFGNELYYGDGTSKIWKAWTGTLDHVLLADGSGTEIQFEVQQAYSDLKMPAAQKQIGMFRPNLLVSYPSAITAVIDYDYTLDSLAPPTAGARPPSVLWDVALWDTGTWDAGGTLYTERNWIQGFGMGSVASLHIAGQASAQLTWLSTDFSVRAGSIL